MTTRPPPPIPDHGIIDCHVHIGLESFITAEIPAVKRARPAFQDRMENRVERQLELMDAKGIARAVVFGFPLEEIDRVAANEYVLDAASRYPDRFLPFMLVGDDTEHWLEKGARGFKQQDILYAPERFDLIRAYSVMAEAGVPMLIHFRHRPDASVAQQARRVIEQVPALKLIVAHMGRRIPNDAAGVIDTMRGLADLPNVYFETSTVRSAAAIEASLAIAGADRVLFGSDFPFNSYAEADPLGNELAIVADAAIPTSAKTKILSTNTLRLLEVAA
jgi:predicted TIM-barrel fold metal-dependent hydrolase